LSKNTLGPLGIKICPKYHLHVLPFTHFNMNFKTKFVMTHFLKLYYNVFILENKIDARVFRRTCINLCYTTLEIALICVILERVSF
jgi:hypothetical protein